MPVVLDVFANTNPAFCSLVIHAFAKSFKEEAGIGPQIALAFLPVPLILSEEVSRTFAGTNALTGLLEWVTRHPELARLLPDSMGSASEISRSSLLFGFQQGIFQLTEASRFIASSGLAKDPKDVRKAPRERRYFSNANSLGKWCGRLNDSRLIFTTLGVQP